METTIITKKSSGRRKIEIKKIEKKNTLQVTFSKHRAGLFKKAAELSILCGVDIAVIVQSPAGKFFSTGGRSPINSIIDRYLGTSNNSNNGGHSNIQQIVEYEDEKKCEEIMKKIDVEKEKKKGLMETRGDNEKGFWWEESIDNLDLSELEEYVAAMEVLEKNALNKAEEMAKANAAVVSLSASASASASASSSLLIPNLAIDCFGGLPVLHYESDNLSPQS